MKNIYQIRKRENITLYLASKVASLDPEKFSNENIPEEIRYTGDGSEEDFLNYISSNFQWQDDFEKFEDYLDYETIEELQKICGDYLNMEEFSNSAQKGENSWFEIGKEDEEYTKYGGFNSHYDTLGESY